MFGTPALAGPEDDTILGKNGHQCLRLALLAVLASTGGRGRSRHQLHRLFWPDSTPAHARHSLEQLLYAIRSSIDEDVFAGVNPVRLNSNSVTSDVDEFRGALKRKDFEAAVEDYNGPFLEGLSLGDAPEFEEWLDSERASLKRSYVDALETLAQQAEAEEDNPAALRWWRRLASADPLSSRKAAGVVRALMKAGDYPAALQYAREYEVVVARELGVSLGGQMAALVAEIRAASS